MQSHLYLSEDSSVGEAVAPAGRCTPILLVVSLFHVVLGGTCVVYGAGRGMESLSGSILVSSMWQVVGMFCLGRRGGEMGDGGCVLYLVLRRGDCDVSGRSWVEVSSVGGGSRIRLGRSVARVVLFFHNWWECVV